MSEEMVALLAYSLAWVGIGVVVWQRQRLWDFEKKHPIRWWFSLIAVYLLVASLGAWFVLGFGSSAEEKLALEEERAARGELFEDKEAELENTEWRIGQ